MPPTSTVQPTQKITTVPLSCSDNESKITNTTICYECDCILGNWKCETYCNESCSEDEDLIQQDGACCFCSPKVVSSTFPPTTTAPHYQCNDDVEIDHLPDENFTSNDGDGSNIKFNKSECWSPTDGSSFVQIDLDKETIISGYRMAGIESGYVESFTLTTKKSGDSQFLSYLDDATKAAHTFLGNSKEQLDVTELFPDGKSIVVDSVRIYPKTLSSDSVCMKFDLVGCTKVVTTAPSTSQPKGQFQLQVV